MSLEEVFFYKRGGACTKHYSVRMYKYMNKDFILSLTYGCKNDFPSDQPCSTSQRL